MGFVMILRSIIVAVLAEVGADMCVVYSRRDTTFGNISATGEGYTLP